LSTPCMIVASMIEAVIIPRFATRPRASLLTLPSLARQNQSLLMISRGYEIGKSRK
jgi:hypothetical protein